MSFAHNDIYSIKIFLNNKYYIPNYQREYSWETDQIDEFWNDLEETISLDEEITHFFGKSLFTMIKTTRRSILLMDSKELLLLLFF